MLNSVEHEKGFITSGPVCPSIFPLCSHTLFSSPPPPGLHNDSSLYKLLINGLEVCISFGFLSISDFRVWAYPSFVYFVCF